MSSPLKILGMADLHGRADRLAPFKDVDVDLIAFCGDLHGASPDGAESVVEALAGLGPPILIVPGNMDKRSVVDDLWKRSGLLMLHGRHYIHDRYGFIGLGGMVIRDSIRLKDSRRYFHSEREVFDSLARAHREVSGACRVVVLSHQPPFGACDTLYNGERSGSTGLRSFVEVYRPDLLICGHIHEDRGETEIGSTKVVNAGEMGRGYAALIELGEGVRVRWIEP